MVLDIINSFINYIFTNIGNYGLPLEDFKLSARRVSIKRSEGLIDDTNFYRLYGLYKQSTIGDYNIIDESDATEDQLTKWSNWKRCIGLSRSKAMNMYIKLTNELLGPHNENDASCKPFISHSRIETLGTYSSFEYEDYYNYIVNGDLEAVKRIISDDPAMVSKTTPEGLTPLHLACDRNNLPLVSYLIENGSDVNAVDDNGDTPLHVAVEIQSDDIIRLLLKFGADTNIRNIDGKCVNELLGSSNI